jgi:pre-mRNA-splicing factor RBM22/SLT11
MKSRFKKTEICQTCAKTKNVCQTCLLDLEYGLPVQVRDKFLEKSDIVQVPKDVVNRDFWAQHMNANVNSTSVINFYAFF